MKHRLVYFLIAGAMLTNILPVSEVHAIASTKQAVLTESRANNAVPTEQQAYESMIALKTEYPEGMSWTNDNFYQWHGGIYSGGYGCAGFAFLLSDEAFGNLPARRLYSFNYEDLKVGDILRMNNDGHSVIILEKNDSYIVIAEGNYNNSIHWGRMISKADVMESDYVMTRYPEPVSLISIALNKSNLSLSEGMTEKLVISYNPSNTTESRDVTWHSDNPKVATVNAGNINALAAGTAVITAKVGTKTARCTVTVIPAMKITVSSRNMSVNTSATFQVTPKQNVTWRTGNSKVATVDQNGKVTARTVGNTWLYAKAVNGQEAKALIKVIPAATGVRITDTSKEVKIGQSFTFKAVVNPTGASQSVTWRTGNSKVATVDKNGKVTAKGIGNTWLYAKTGNGKEAKCLIKVINPATAISFNISSRNMTVGTKYQFKPVIKPIDTTSTVTWRTGNSKVATVDKNGTVLAKSVGNTWLYAKTSNGLEAKVLIRVIPAAESVKITDTSKTLKPGGSYTFKAVVNPTGASQAVTWRTGNSKVATVDKNGKVTARGIGNTWLYAKTGNGKETRILVSVK